MTQQLRAKCTALYNVNSAKFAELEEMPHKVPKSMTPFERLLPFERQKSIIPGVWEVKWRSDPEFEALRAARAQPKVFPNHPLAMTLEQTPDFLSFLEGHAQEEAIQAQVLSWLEDESVELLRLEGQYRTLQKFLDATGTHKTAWRLRWLSPNAAIQGLSTKQLTHLLLTPGVDSYD